MKLLDSSNQSYLTANEETGQLFCLKEIDLEVSCALGYQFAIS